MVLTSLPRCWQSVQVTRWFIVLWMRRRSDVRLVKYKLILMLLLGALLFLSGLNLLMVLSLIISNIRRLRVKWMSLTLLCWILVFYVCVASRVCWVNPSTGEMIFLLRILQKEASCFAFSLKKRLQIMHDNSCFHVKEFEENEVFRFLFSV